LLLLLDTNVLIYWLERPADSELSTLPLFAAIHAGQHRALVSEVSIGEFVAGRPERDSSRAAGILLQPLAEISNLGVVPVSLHVWIQAGSLRAKSGVLGLIDCVLVATALLAGADALVTADRRLASARSGVKVLTWPDWGP
jgi:predicted nucleic acid-binding protein